MRHRRKMPRSVMTASLFLVLGVVSSGPVMAQNPPWVVQAGGPVVPGGGPVNAGAGLAIASDSAGNSYVTGRFSGTVTFGSGALAVSRTAAGFQDMYVASYSATGDLRWVQQSGVQSGKTVGGVLVDLTNPNAGTIVPASATGTGIVIDANNNVYVTGWFQGRNAFSGALSTSWIDTNLFIVRYTNAGQLRPGAIRAYSAIHPFDSSLPSPSAGPPTCDESVNKLHVHPGNFPPDAITGWGIAARDGNSGPEIHVTGSFSGDVCFGSSKLRTASGRGDVFAAKYNILGGSDPEWITTAGGTGSETANGRGIAVDTQGQSYVVGNFTGTMSFKDTILLPNGPGLTSVGSQDVFVAKFDSNGTAITGWPRRYGSVNEDTAAGIALDSAGAIFVTGGFASGAFPSGTGSSSPFLVKLDDNGAPLWTRGAGLQIGSSVVVDGHGNEYVTGMFTGGTRPPVSLTLGAITGNNVTVTAGANVFALLDIGKQIRHATLGIAQIVGVTPPQQGSFTSPTVTVNILEDFASTVVLNTNWELVAPLNFTTLSDPRVLLFGTGLRDMFIAKYDTNGHLLLLGQGQPQPASGSVVIGAAVAVDGDNAYVTGLFNGLTTVAVRYIDGMPNLDPGRTLTASGNETIFVAKFESPVPPPLGLSLTITTNGGTGVGRVTSLPSGIDCGSTCQASFTTGQAVTLFADADPGSTFGEWSRDCSGSGLSTVVDMDAAKTCHARFDTALQSIAVTPPNASITVKTTLGFTATATYSNGSTQDVTLTALWASTVPFVATVDATGHAFGVNAGPTTISASLGAVIGSTPLTVNPASTTMALSSPQDVWIIGQAVPITATVTGAGPTAGASGVTFVVDGDAGNPLAGTITLTPPSTLVATLSLSNLALGLHTIVASYGGDANNVASAPASIRVFVVNINASGTAVRGILTGTSGNIPFVFRRLAGGVGVESSLTPLVFDMRFGSASAHGFLRPPGPTVGASTVTYSGPTNAQSAARAIAYATYVNVGTQSVEAPADAILDGFFTGTAPSHASAAVYVFERDPFLNAIASSGTSLPQFLLDGDTLSDYAAGTKAALSLTTARSGPVRPALFAAPLASEFTLVSNAAGNSVNTRLSPRFTVNPNEAVIILFDLTVYSERGGLANFSATLKPGPDFLRDTDGNLLPLSTAAVSFIPPEAANLALTPTASTNALTTPVTVTATATTASGTPVPNTLVFFDVVAGPNANPVGPAMTDANGQATFTYSGGSATGTDLIQAHIGTLLSNVASVTWTQPVVPASVRLAASATAVKNGAGQYVLTITVKNSGNTAATGVQLASAALNGNAGAPGPIALSDVPAGGGVTVVETFPATAGTAGSANTLRLQVNWLTGSATISLRVTLP